MTGPDDAYPPPPGYRAPGYERPTAAYGSPPGWPPASSYGVDPHPYPGAGYAGPQQTSAKAFVALGMAIAAYTPIVPFLGALIALFLASSAKRDIRSSGGRQSGLGLCRAATVLAVIHLVLIALVLVIVLGVVIGPLAFLHQ